MVKKNTPVEKNRPIIIANGRVYRPRSVSIEAEYRSEEAYLDSEIPISRHLGTRYSLVMETTSDDAISLMNCENTEWQIRPSGRPVVHIW